MSSDPSPDTSADTSIHASAPPPQQEIITPSHVYQKTREIIALVHHLREQKWVTRSVPQPRAHWGRTPLHVYGKTLEVMRRSAELQRIHQTAPYLQVPPLQIDSEIEPANVYRNMEQIEQALTRIAEVLGHRHRKSTPLVRGKTPSDVYQQMVYLDRLLQSLTFSATFAVTPQWVYRNALEIGEQVKRLNQLLQQPAMRRPERPLERGKVPRDVMILVQQSIHYLSQIEQQLGLEGIAPPPFPVGVITPAHVYESSGMLKAELSWLLFQRGVAWQGEKAIVDRVLPEHPTPSHLHRLMAAVAEQLLQLLQQLKR